MRKRVKGRPMQGTVTIVTTDVEGYSGGLVLLAKQEVGRLKGGRKIGLMLSAG